MNSVSFKHTRSSKGRAGFSLIELMICLAIVGILASLATTSWWRSTARARRSEATSSLYSIYNTEKLFYGHNGYYAKTFDELGFNLIGAQQIDASTLKSKYYTYTLSTSNNDLSFRAVATGDVDLRDPFLDVLHIDGH